MAKTESNANRWPQGGLFAFSGVDGETCHAEPFVASGMRDCAGWDFWLKPRVRLSAQLGETPLQARPCPEDLCLPDCWRFAADADGLPARVAGAFLDRSSMTVTVSADTAPDGLWPELMLEATGPAPEGLTVVPCEGCWLAISADPPGKRRRYGVAVSYASGEEASERAERAREADVVEATDARLAFCESIRVPETLSGSKQRAFYKAVGVMKVNVESAQLDIPCRWSTPDRMPHRHMWLWDTAFGALGLQHLRQDLAQDALRALAAKQYADGRMPLAAQPERPGELGRADARLAGGESQPPIVAWSVWRHFRHSGNADFVREMYPSLVRYIEWFELHRLKPNGLYGWFVRVEDDPIRGARGGESGMDNSPRFDAITKMTAVDLSSYMANEYECLAEMAELLGNPAQAAEWQARRDRIAALVNKLLWDDEQRFYFDLLETGEFITIKTTAGFMPLLAKIPSRDQAEALRTHLVDKHEFWTAFPLASVALDEPAFSKDMWRGPAWANVNVLLYHALTRYGFAEEAHALAHETIEGIVKCYVRWGCLYEYYDSLAETPPAELPRKGAPGALGGVGFGVVEDLDWTAAALIHLANELA